MVLNNVKSLNNSKITSGVSILLTEFLNSSKSSKAVSLVFFHGCHFSIGSLIEPTLYVLPSLAKQNKLGTNNGGIDF